VDLLCRMSNEQELFPFIVCTQELLSVKLLDTDSTDQLQMRLARAMAIIRFLCFYWTFWHSKFETHFVIIIIS